MADLTFTVDSALLSELGEKLVESVHVALLELVKNAYDADATVVTVELVTTASGSPEVTISDDGTGMTFDEVEKYWMRIATTNKVKNDASSVYGRPRTGSKGIGRFSCRRLGTKLVLETIAKNREGKLEKTEVTFPWDKFEAGSELTTIKCPGSREYSPKARLVQP
jgi:HSP90 family molecular chaperone